MLDSPNLLRDINLSITITNDDDDGDENILNACYELGTTHIHTHMCTHIHIREISGAHDNPVHIFLF